jgi:hypothetical protein
MLFVLWNSVVRRLSFVVRQPLCGYPEQRYDCLP